VGERALIDQTKELQPQLIAFHGVLEPKDGHLITAAEIEAVTTRFLDSFYNGGDYDMEFGLKIIDRCDWGKLPTEERAVDPCCNSRE